jgi:hypothetical protein
MVEDGDKVWGHFRARGTNESPFMGQDPSGKVMEIDVIDISRFQDGKDGGALGRTAWVPFSNWGCSHDPAEGWLAQRPPQGELRRIFLLGGWVNKVDNPEATKGGASH